MRLVTVLMGLTILVISGCCAAPERDYKYQRLEDNVQKLESRIEFLEQQVEEMQQFKGFVPLNGQQ